MDFRRAGGKKPSALRGIRPISVGDVSLGNITQESWVHGGSESVVDRDEDGSRGLSAGLAHPLGSAFEFALASGELSPRSPSNKSS